MSTEALVSILAAALAVVALMPTHRRLVIGLRLGRTGWLIGFAAGVLIHWIKFRTSLDALGLPATLGTWRWHLTDESASYLIALSTALLLVLLAKYGRLSGSQVATFRDLVESLLAERKYTDIVHLLDAHLTRLIDFAKKGSGLPRLRRLIQPESRWEMIASHPTAEGEQHVTMSLVPIFKRAGTTVRARVASLLPETNDSTDAAEELVHRVYTTDALVDEIAKSRPSLGLQMLVISDRETVDFLARLTRAWLDDPSSLLYHELENNQGLVGGNRYYIPPTNRILYRLLSRATDAHEYRVYKGFGDDLLRELDRLALAPQTDRYRKPLGDFREEEASTSRLFASVHLFRVMVTEALYQGVKWHMWLYYLPPAVAKATGNLGDLGTDVELSREWPTPYHYLLYEIVSVHRDWIETGAELYPGQPNTAIETTSPEHDNGSILKSATVSLGQCCKTILQTPNLTVHFKSYLLEVVLRLIRDLASEEKTGRVAEALALSLLEGGPHHLQADTEYQEALESAIREVDHVIRWDLKDSPQLGPLIERIGFGA